MKRLIPILFLVSCSSPELENVDKQGYEDVSSEVGEPDGDYVAYYNNGSVKLKGVIENGERTRVWTSYHLNGTKASENGYKNGELNGKTVSFFDSGQVRYIGYYENGAQAGFWRFYKEDGSEAFSENYSEIKLE